MIDEMDDYKIITLIQLTKKVLMISKFDLTTRSSNPYSPTRSGPVHVLLLTEGRSGSTWLSSFFWHRQEVYYTFEPLYQTPVWKQNGCSKTPVSL